MTSVGFGDRSVKVPVAEIDGNRSGRTLLVTGGTDGDEYAGMEAAYGLIKKYADGDFAGRLVVVPVVNVPGFEAECSQNPMDGKFPKLVGLGNARGTPTDRLMRWLVETHAFKADAWLDLHGGAMTEGVRPFVWTFQTGVNEPDLLAQAFMRSCGADTALVERCGAGKAVELARQGCAYALVESGARGRCDAESVSRHVAWSEAMMRCLGMIDGKAVPRDPERVLSRVQYVRVPYAGAWHPADFSPDAIERGMTLGTCFRLDGTDQRTITAPVSGTGLWWKETMAMRDGDILIAIGSH
ncbi:hypothetical protein A2501_02870 [Candidatus Uhrbacteria bacterium RIFOXYC12_FULL_57_11]|nr:MAG: hypothetical protein A2501_02870 [Candidatus Uhrbacteria bacterium RIFOXYC12_FULL_57_11]